MRHFLPLLVLSLAAVACGQRAPAPAPVAPSAPQPPALSMTVTPTTIDDSVLATVNGQPVTISDVRMALRLTRADQDPEEAQLGPALEGLIRQEIIVQAAVGIGLDKDPKYQADYAKALTTLATADDGVTTATKSVKAARGELFIALATLRGQLIARNPRQPRVVASFYPRSPKKAKKVKPVAATPAAPVA